MTLRGRDGSTAESPARRAARPCEGAGPGHAAFDHVDFGFGDMGHEIVENCGFSRKIPSLDPHSSKRLHVSWGVGWSVGRSMPSNRKRPEAPVGSQVGAAGVSDIDPVAHRAAQEWIGPMRRDGDDITFVPFGPDMRGCGVPIGIGHDARLHDEMPAELGGSDSERDEPPPAPGR